MGAHAVNRWGWGHDVQIHTCDRGNGVDQTDRIRATAHGGLRRLANIGNIWR